MNRSTIALIALVTTVVVAVVAYFVYKHYEKYEPSTGNINMQLENLLSTGGQYLQNRDAYVAYPSGELTFNPLVNLPKRKYGPMDGTSGLPEGRFVKGHFNNVYTPDLLWCKNGDCSALTYQINAGDIFYNTSGKVFVSVNPAIASPDEKAQMASLAMQSDGSLLVHPSGGRDQYMVPVVNNQAFPVLCIGLDTQGKLYVLNSDASVKGLINPLFISTDPASKGSLMEEAPEVVDPEHRQPFAVLQADCSFAVYSGGGIFAYRASLF